MAAHVKRIIVNADDLGLSQQVNDGARVLMEAGLVTSGTIMANGPCWSEATALARSKSNLSFGVHLILVLIMGRDSDSGDIPLVIPGCRNDHTPDLGYFARTLSQKRTALSLGYTLTLF